ncbi:Solute carrier family 35 member F1 [Vitis vinifera]|uniref:Solute carrier family 35 member F1 n=1 Tax=Vitis vinifera TaxID=29760 RepID=A0A438EK17_VITVI|nr:Solute carrier family 35 member F1 [Vitis vinifera]
MSSWWRSHGILLRTFYVLFLGQVVSFVLAVASFSSSFIADLGVDAPSYTEFLHLFVFSFGLWEYLVISWYWYLFLGFVDVQGNYLVNKAYQYSSITSVTLLDCWTIPWVIILTWIFLGTRYSLWQFFGAALCIVGLGLVLLSDAGVGGGDGSRPLLGDILVIAGTLFFALSNVGEEFCVKKKDRVEVVTMIGIFGLLVSVCEISIMELKSLESVEWSTDIILGFVGYAVSTFLFYTIVPFLLQISGATWFNLSLLTSDMWAVVIRIFFYHQKVCSQNLSVDWLYFISFAMVAVGLIIYSKTGNQFTLCTEPKLLHLKIVLLTVFCGSEKDPIPLPTLGDGNHNAEYQVLDEEGTESRNETPAS